MLGFHCFRFILQLLLKDGSATLNVVETNPFKHLIHLSLNVLPGNDEAIKTFLSDCLREYKARTIIGAVICCFPSLVEFDE